MANIVPKPIGLGTFENFQLKKNMTLQIRYRPIQFSQVIGQSVAVNVAIASLNQDRIQSTYLLVGPSGSGKTTLARIMARALNCINPNGVEPCNQCDSCQAHLKGNHLAIAEIDGADRNGVDDVREIIEKCQLNTIGSKYRVYIIDEAHMMSKSAQNAMLKLLEDPPKDTIFLLCTTEEEKLLETIRSRARILRFHIVDKNYVVGFLMAVAQQEEISLTTEEAQRIYDYHKGSIRQCLQTLGTVSSKVTVADLCPQIPQEEIHNLLLAFDVRDYLAINEILRRVTNNGFYPKDLLTTLIDTTIDLMAMPDTSRNFVINANRVLEAILPAVNRLGNGSHALVDCRLALYEAVTVWQPLAPEPIQAEIENTLATHAGERVVDLYQDRHQSEAIPQLESVSQVTNRSLPLHQAAVPLQPEREIPQVERQLAPQFAKWFNS